MSKLKLVDGTTTPPENSEFLAKCQAEVEKLIILGASTMVLIADVGNEVEIRSIPRSTSLEMGAIASASMYYPLLGGSLGDES